MHNIKHKCDIDNHCITSICFIYSALLIEHHLVICMQLRTLYLVSPGTSFLCIISQSHASEIKVCELIGAHWSLKPLL